MIAHNHDFDMTSLAECITNEVEIEHDYVGWWYSCIPVTFINKNKLRFRYLFIVMILNMDYVQMENLFY